MTATAGELDPELKARIQAAYRAWLQARGFAPRAGQRQMIGTIARTLAEVEQDDDGLRLAGAPHLCVVEAGTGTGKTVAYGLASIPVALARNLRLVISTATVALQDQLITRDLPDLEAQAGLHFTFALAKGRGRYVCPSRLDRHLAEDMGLGTPGELFADAAPVSVVARGVYREMFDALQAGRWDGERESWHRAVDDPVWAAATVDHRGCTGPKCPFFSGCPYYLTRETLQRADVIVANHDLVLSDLALGGGVILPEPEHSIYVFDEGHHLADKALGHLRRFTRVLASVQTLEALDRLLGTLAQRLGRDGVLVDQARRVAAAAEPLRQQLRRMLELAEALPGLEQPRPGQRPLHRFPLGEVPAPMRELAGELVTALRDIAAALERALERLRALGDDAGSERDHWTSGLSQYAGRIEAALALWEDYARPAAAVHARWVSRIDHDQGLDLEFQASPLQAGQALQEVLWDRCHAAVVTSATLASTDGFRRFAEAAGIPPRPDTVFLHAPSGLPYEQAAELVVPAMRTDPRQAAAHNEEIAGLLPELIRQDEGTLVIFTSWRQLQEVTARLPAALVERVLSQADLAKGRILRDHQARIDAGEGSVIFGLASFAEGVDLVGDYCRHVIITKLPFAVPDDPVEAAMAEWLESEGRNAFNEISVPDTALKLKQACGRLLRSEQDRGRITLLDRRIATRAYGRAMLETLPPFRRRIERG